MDQLAQRFEQLQSRMKLGWREVFLLFFSSRIFTYGERGVIWSWGLTTKVGMASGFMLQERHHSRVLEFLEFMVFGSVARRDWRDDILQPHALIQNLLACL